MTNKRPEIETDQAFTITESASLLAVARSTLYRYIAKMRIVPHLTGTSGLPFLTGADVLKIWDTHFKA